MPNIHAVTLTIDNVTKRYSREFQTLDEHASSWKSVLARAHRKHPFVCCCSGPGDKLLCVRNFDGADKFTLARYPLSGPEHATDCRFYDLDTDSCGLKCYEKGVLQVRADSSLKVVLNIGLERKEATGATTTPDPPVHKQGGVSQRAMSLKGLLHLLWSEAEINVWRPRMEGKRYMGRVHWFLNVAAQSISVGRVLLEDVLLVMAANANSSDAERNSERFVNARNKNRRLLVITTLANYSTDNERKAETKSLPIAGINGLPRLQMAPGLWKDCAISHPREVAGWRAGSKLIVIAEVEPLPKNSKFPPAAKVVQLALMQINAQWIPVDSSHELRIADKLVAEKRSFIKPLRFDAAKDVVFPDFILIDTQTPVPLEVFGRDDEAYEERKQEKTSFYTAKYGSSGWWCWNAAMDPNGQNISAFPEKKHLR